MCSYYTACSLKLSGSAAPTFLLLLFILPLQSLQVQLVWACAHIQCACVCDFHLGSCFRRQSFVSVFLFICFEMVNIARELCMYNRMRKITW